jgi:hypothetical protein
MRNGLNAAVQDRVAEGAARPQAFRNGLLGGARPVEEWLFLLAPGGAIRPLFFR